MKTQANPILKIDALCKHFAGIYALRDASFELLPGEIHALTGENGAGKSTLIKILSGIHKRDEGQISVAGKAVQIDSTAAAKQLGISVIYQDFDLAPNLSITDNLLLGQEPAHVFGLINGRERKELAHKYLQNVGLSIDPHTLAENLTIAQRQLVAIAKAISQEARILVMDEPTSALAAAEIEYLLELIVKLKANGTSIIFISHKLDEIFKIADRVTVFRDGQTIATRHTSETSIAEVVSMMVGRNLGGLFSRESHVQNDILLEARGIERDSPGISFSLYKGEILGIYGLKGAGRTDLMRSIFGLDAPKRIELTLEGTVIPVNSPRDAIRLGIAYVTEDRKTEGLFPNMDVKENLSIAALDNLNKLGFLSRGQEQEKAAEFISRLNIRTQSLDQGINELSGGNQQKIILARWLINNPRLLILDEPTAGIDVGAKSEIYQFINQLTAGGIGVILVTSELPELLGMSDRILVMAGGKFVGEFERSEATEEKIMHAIHA